MNIQETEKMKGWKDEKTEKTEKMFVLSVFRDLYFLWVF